MGLFVLLKAIGPSYWPSTNAYLGDSRGIVKRGGAPPNAPPDVPLPTPHLCNKHLQIRFGISADTYTSYLLKTVDGNHALSIIPHNYSIRAKPVLSSITITKS